MRATKVDQLETNETCKPNKDILNFGDQSCLHDPCDDDYDEYDHREE